MAGFACSQLVPSSPAEGARRDHCSNPGGQQQWDGAVLAGTLGCTLGCSPSCWPPALTFLLALLEVGGRRPAREDAGEPGSSPHSTGGAASPFIQCLPSSGTLGSPHSRVLQQVNSSCSSLGDGFQAMLLYLQRNPSPVVVGQSFSNKN